ncbi:MAG TPA: hypothetical protein VKT78_12100, partial [Fimbriimonadaceae bacterium]|nr:hypothetical protein [Fimbriimonadaceae bacterium]
MDAAQFITLVLAGLTVFLAVFAIVNEYRSNDVDRDDGPRCKQLARMGTMSAVVCGVLAFSVFGVSMLMRGPSQEIVATKPNASSAPQPAPVGSPAPSGGGAQSPAAQVPVATGPSPVIASAPVGPPPSFDTMAGSSQPSYAQGNSGASNYQWDSPSQNGTAARGDADDAAGKPADRRPKKVACPFTPVAYSVALRFSSEDASIHRFVDRVVRQAERDSGISITSSNDKLASLRITPNAEFVYADGKSSQLGASAAYSPRAGDKAASRYLFNPEISVTVTRENGSRASFSKRVAWA